MAASIDVTIEPLDDSRCKFILSRPVYGSEVMRFTSPESAAGFPVAEAVLAVPGVCEIVVAGRVLTAVKHSDRSWSELAETVRYAVATAVSGLGDGARESTASTTARMDDDTMFRVASRLIDRDINPAVAKHGGKIDLIDVQDATVVLRMLGGCQGCGMASVTLKQGIESSLRQAIPGLRGIADITDHASGTNPYFSAAKK